MEYVRERLASRSKSDNSVAIGLRIGLYANQQHYFSILLPVLEVSRAEMTSVEQFVRSLYICSVKARYTLLMQACCVRT